MALSDVKARNAKAAAKPYKLSDGEGMYLLVTPAGGKIWRLKYRFDGKEKLLVLGAYPQIGLIAAREKRLEAKKALANGIDPGEAKQKVKRESIIAATDNFEAIAREWHAKRKHKWKSNTARINLGRLEQHVFPMVGPHPISNIEAPEWLAVFHEIEKRGTIYTARRVKQTVSKIYSYAIASSRAKYNPVFGLNEALTTTPKSKNRSYLKAEELPEFFQKLESSDLLPQTKLSLRFVLLTFVRTIELRAGQWTEIDFKKTDWRIPPERMKMKKPHIVPLSKQAVTILKELKKLSGESKYIVPNQNDDERFMSENTMLFGLYRMGYHSRATVHGFRSTASTILNENGFQPDWIERQLAHEEPNAVRSAYNHAQYLPERRKMMQWWADYLDKTAAKK